MPSVLSSTAPMAAHRHLLAALALPVTLLIIFLWRRHYKKRLRLPPGPPGWPIAGNLFQVAFSGKQFTQYVSDLIPIYGELFTIRMGVRTLIFIAGADLAREALIEKGMLFVNRPAENPTRSVFSCNKFTVNSALYGSEWRSLRRNMVSGMLSSARLREFHDVRRAAMDRFIDRIREEADSGGSGGGTVWVLRHARFAVFCILLSMCFGLDLDEESIVLIDVLMKKVLITISPRLDEFLPLLRPFFSKKRAEAMEVRREQIATVVSLIEKRKAILKNPSEHPGAAPFSYLDSLLDLQIEGRSSGITEDELVTLCSELINGGTDTTATAIEWGVAQLIDKPYMQQRIFEEITAAVGDDPRPVTEKETEKMVYLQAFVKELLRKHPPTYFSLTHAAVLPEKLRGYDIPPDANLEIYFPAISEDPKLWRQPDEFDPERFLTGGETADITGVKEIKMIPFGAGRRVCPGLAMGMTHITLMLARMVQAFEWLPPPEQPKINFGSKLEFTVIMNPPLRATVVPRK